MTLSAAPQAPLDDRRWNDGKFHFDPTKPRWIQIATIVAQMSAFFGGLILGLVSMIKYPMLLTGGGLALTWFGPIAAAFAASFLMIPKTWWPADMPAYARLQMRLGIGLCAAGWFIGLFGIANGYATPVAVRDFPMAYRRTSTPSDPKRMSYYVGTRVWASSRNVYEITVPPALWASLDVPVVTQWSIPRQQLDAMPDHGALRLAVGRGRFGIDWLHGVVGAGAAGAR